MWAVSCVHVPAAADVPSRPTDEERHAMPAFVFGTLLPAHAGVEAAFLCAGGGSVVRGENENRVVSQTKFLELLLHPRNVLVNVGNHPVKLGPRRGNTHFLVGFGVFGINSKGTVRRIGGKVNQKRLVFVFLDEFHGSIEPNVGAIFLESFKNPVVPIGIAEIIVAPIVGRLHHAAAAVDQDFLKPLVLGSAGVIVPQMPLAEDPRFVTGLGKYLGERDFIGVHQRAAHDRVPNSGSAGIAARHQCRARGRASGIDVIVRQPHALGMQLDPCWAF